MNVLDGWKQAKLGELLDSETCRKVDRILQKGGGTRELLPILAPHSEALEQKGVDSRFLAYAIIYEKNQRGKS